jgi:hypothetical protein
MIILRPIMEVCMLLVRSAVVAAAAVMAVFALKRVMAGLQMATAAIRPGAGQRPPVKLRQDPRTGIYYPED